MENNEKMDNLKENSILSQNEDSATVYLSFNSTLSNTAFQTMNSDIMEIEDQSTIQSDSRNSHMESTLEANDHTWGPANTVMKAEAPTLKFSSAMPKRVLQALKGNSSTPNKEPLHDIQIINSPMKNNFLQVNPNLSNVKDSKDLYASDEENKENTPPMICPNLTVNTTSPIKPGNEISTDLSTVMTKPDVPEKKELIPFQVCESVTGVMHTNQSNNVSGKTSNIKESINSKTISNTKITRKSVCEPNLQTNRPSRILAANTETQIYPKTRKTKIGGGNLDVPKIKVSRQDNIDKAGVAVKATTTVSTNENNPLENKKRKSLLPISQVNRRRASFIVRTSIVARPSPNSPARIIPRKSTFPNSTLASRKSLLPINPATRSKKPSSAYAPALTSLQESAGNSETVAIPKISQPKLIEKEQNSMNSKFQPVKPSQKHVGIHPMSRSEQSFTCSICSCKFRIKSLLDAHRYVHLSEQPSGRKGIEKQNTAASVSTTDNQCKYCDKKFALVRTLHIHLLQNCPKIPPTEKRKLEFTEMNHVEKAQLPNVFHAHSNSGNINSFSKRTTMANVLAKKSDSSLSSNQESLVDYTGLKHDFDTESTGSGQMLAPANNYVKKSAVHAGVYVTPKKAIQCNNCNKQFKTVLDYTEHCFKHHFNKTASSADDEQTD